MMKLNDIKKALYKQKPTAIMLNKENGIYRYYTEIQHEDMPVEIDFEIPVKDMGDAIFHHEMEAHLLIRWIFSPNT